MLVLILENGMRLTYFFWQVSFSRGLLIYWLKGVIMIFYTIIAIFVKLKFAFKIILG